MQKVADLRCSASTLLYEMFSIVFTCVQKSSVVLLLLVVKKIEDFEKLLTIMTLFFKNFTTYF